MTCFCSAKGELSLLLSKALSLFVLPLALLILIIALTLPRFERDHRGAQLGDMNRANHRLAGHYRVGK